MLKPSLAENIGILNRRIAMNEGVGWWKALYTHVRTESKITEVWMMKKTKD